MRRMMFVPLSLAMLAATSGAFANPAHKQLEAMQEPERRAFFVKFLSGSGERCGSVTRTFFQGSSSNGDAFWNVACAGGANWSVMIYNNATGSTRILDCKVLKALNAGTCFTKFR